MATMLSARGERISADAQVPDSTLTIPGVPSTTYRDLFGNSCRCLIASAGDIQLWGDGTIADSGKHDPIDPHTGETPVVDLPDDCPVFLLGSRYCETNRLSQIARDLFGQVPPGWGRAQAICDWPTRTSPSTIRPSGRRARPMTRTWGVAACVVTSPISPSPCEAVHFAERDHADDVVAGRVRHRVLCPSSPGSPIPSLRRGRRRGTRQRWSRPRLSQAPPASPRSAEAIACGSAVLRDREATMRNSAAQVDALLGGRRMDGAEVTGRLGQDDQSLSVSRSHVVSMQDP